MTNQTIQRKRNSLLREAATKVFPVLKQEKTQSFIILVLTFLSLIIFGLFAINPTVATILQLRKQLADNILVHNKLQEKITNLSILQGKFNTIQPDLPLVLAAVPASHNIPEFFGQVQELTTKNNLELITMQSDPLTLNTTNTQQRVAVGFSFTVQGNREDVLNFITSFMSFERLTIITNLLLNTTNTEQGNVTQALIQGKIFFKPLQ